MNNWFTEELSKVLIEISGRDSAVLNAIKEMNSHGLHPKEITISASGGSKHKPHFADVKRLWSGDTVKFYTVLLHQNFIWDETKPTVVTPLAKYLEKIRRINNVKIKLHIEGEQ